LGQVKLQQDIHSTGISGVWFICLQVDAKFKAQEAAFAADDDDDKPAAAAADTAAAVADEAAAAAEGGAAGDETATDHSEL
jgi:hypothetical protein